MKIESNSVAEVGKLTEIPKKIMKYSITLISFLLIVISWMVFHRNNYSIRFETMPNVCLLVFSLLTLFLLILKKEKPAQFVLFNFVAVYLFYNMNFAIIKQPGVNLAAHVLYFIALIISIGFIVHRVNALVIIGLLLINFVVIPFLNPQFNWFSVWITSGAIMVLICSVIVFYFTSLQQKLLKNAESYSEHLENCVKERTAEIELQKEELHTTLENLKQTQSELIQSEKMASLGLLIAGIAHEINSPLSAIKASVNNMIETNKQIILNFPNLLKQLNENEFSLFIDLINRSVQNTNQITSKEERLYRKKLTKEIEEKNIENADIYADFLVDMGIYDTVESYIPIMSMKNIQAAFNLSQQMKNSQNIKVATDKVAKIVFALKSYAHSSPSSEKSKIQIIDTIENVLTIYHNQIKHGINITKDFGDVPEIFCYPDELNQVWTNLIYNAIQAMNSKGELTIRVSTHHADTNGHVSLCISITDTGCGIPPENMSKIFDAFFTTKPAGEGSGLGLHICKQIIDKHDGKIWVTSEIGKGTSFFVELPVR